jgi:uncharacterized membrane protein
LSEINWWAVINNNWGKIIGALLGLVFALLVINYGFWLSMFLFLCIAVGLLIGWRLDVSKNVGRFFNRLFSSKDDY